MERADGYCRQHKITKRELFKRLGMTEQGFSHFRRGYCVPNPQRMENMIALFGITSTMLKSCEQKEEIRQPKVEAEIPAKEENLPEKQDALSLVQEALEYYKNKDKHIAALGQIISEAQQLIKVLGGAV